MMLSELNRQILRLSQEGLPRVDFLEEVSAELLDYTGCDSLELRLADEFLQYVWVYPERVDGKKLAEKYFIEEQDRLLPCFEGEEISEQVCRDLFRERYDPQLKYHYQRQSVLISDSYTQHRYCKAGVTLGEESGYGSLLYLSFLTNDEIPGLLILKKQESGYFRQEDTLIYENLAQTLGIAIAFRRSQYELGERVKELSCLHSISKLLQESELSLDETFERLVLIVPRSFQYPHHTGCCLKIAEREYSSRDYNAAGHLLSEAISLGKEKIGEIEVSLNGVKRDFLPEETDLLVSIAGATGAIYQKLLAEEERREVEEKLRMADRLATIGQLAAGIAHELNEPLSNILGYAQLAEAEIVEENGLSEDLKKIVSSSLHAREIVRKLLLFAHQMPMHRSLVDINELIRESLQIVGSRLNKSGIEVKVELAENLPVIKADSSQIRQVVINLLVNALQAMSKGGSLLIKTLPEEGYVRLIIKDSGIGMSQGIQKKIFLPFFTTKPQGEGTGLGLAVVHGIIKAHAGRIEIKSAPDKGTKVTVFFPTEGKGESSR